MTHLKYLLTAGLILVVIMLASISTNSCSNSTTAQSPVNDTIHLVSDPQVIHFNTSDTTGNIHFSADSIRVWLTCGCPFALNETGNVNISPRSGYTTEFSTISLVPDSSRVTPHYLSLNWDFSSANPTALPDSTVLGEGQLIFSALDHFGNMKYDTIQVIAETK